MGEVGQTVELGHGVVMCACTETGRAGNRRVFCRGVRLLALVCEGRCLIYFKSYTLLDAIHIHQSVKAV